uniref:NR LBD domain-containing protein n=1 Tax=Plectus sambesii TaxID=2011161 RepID=A0A914W5T0_9BILA
MGRVGLLNATEWGQSFAEFKQLSMDMKTNVLRLFTIAFVLIEQGYLTSRQDDPDLWILQNNTYICTDYFRGMTAAEINEPENHVRAKILPELIVQVINEVGVPMKILKVDLKECAALKTIIFWSSHADLPLETRQSFLKQRDTMFLQLMRYCSSKKYTNDSAEARFGSLMLLITNIMQCARAFLDQVRLVNFFQMMEIDSLVKDVFL